MSYTALLPCTSFLLAFSALFGANAQDVIRLPAPARSGGKPLIETLWQRQTVREIKAAPLSDEVLGNLLWAAFGVNRPANQHRTAPSAMNSQEIDIYVAMQKGLWIYHPQEHALRLISKIDVRSKTSGQPFGTNAPVTLIFVADLLRLDKAPGDTKLIYANFDAGCICQNVYLFCASEGLASVVHDLDRALLVEPMQLKDNQRIIMAQAVGWPETR